jgi:hypothetical protein
VVDSYDEGHATRLWYNNTQPNLDNSNFCLEIKPETDVQPLGFNWLFNLETTDSSSVTITSMYRNTLVFLTV